MSIIFKYTLFSLQGHIHILQGHKVCTRTRYFNACLFHRVLCIEYYEYYAACFKKSLQLEKVCLCKALKVHMTSPFFFQKFAVTRRFE